MGVGKRGGREGYGAEGGGRETYDCVVILMKEESNENSILNTVNPLDSAPDQIYL